MAEFYIRTGKDASTAALIDTNEIHNIMIRDGCMTVFALKKIYYVYDLESQKKIRNETGTII